ncbi:hypothetical protein [Adhaeribacter rhizoryzae]|uniref:Uncharacterized protein n=1 Tax=Adhaeribacter rhizoryzae TaxID=2607907 RepID=A0A5M6CTV5_9BACT|nr:hypothetical protein [Adhaeribacter rhizoryzae]KAA5538687.1 hypothetical protein F0145_25770 [Adhaeribacter rhizoryzae]
MKVNIHKHVNFSEKDIEKLSSSIQVLQAVLGSSEFKEEVLKYTYNGKNGYYYRKNIKGDWIDQPYSNEEVYRIIMKGQEKLGNIHDNECDLYLEIDKDDHSTVIGYTYPGDKTIYTYRNWFRSFNAIGYASHLAHEWCHELGFSHSKKKTVRRKHSVPYAIGNMIGRIYPQLKISNNN